MRKNSTPAKGLQPGTPCIVRGSGPCKAHDGKVVVVKTFDRPFNGYQCEPQLLDPLDGARLIWRRESLIPLNGGDGMDEMLRIVSCTI